jgi:hypothetical protein
VKDKRSKMATAVVETDISHDELHCVLCCEDIDYSACGSCDHPICLKCCVKLRLLRKEYECPVCRAKLEMVSGLTLYIIVIYFKLITQLLLF